MIEAMSGSQRFDLSDPPEPPPSIQWRSWPLAESFLAATMVLIGLLAAGAGIEVPFGRGHVTFDVRYTAGLTTLSKEPDDNIRNGSVSLLLGYMF